MRSFNYSCKLSWRHLREHSQLSQQQQLWFYEPPLQENRHEVPPPGSDITLNTGIENKQYGMPYRTSTVHYKHAALPEQIFTGHMERWINHYSISPSFLGKLILPAYWITERWING